MKGKKNATWKENGNKPKMRLSTDSLKELTTATSMLERIGTAGKILEEAGTLRPYVDGDAQIEQWTKLMENTMKVIAALTFRASLMQNRIFVDMGMKSETVYKEISRSMAVKDCDITLSLLSLEDGVGLPHIVALPTDFWKAWEEGDKNGCRKILMGMLMDEIGGNRIDLGKYDGETSETEEFRIVE